MRILLLEDEPEMARALLEALRRRDVLADHVRTIADADAMARVGTYDVLVLTALGSVDHRVDGLDSGADDYLAKPFAIEELLARLRALQRRGPAVSDRYLTFGNLSVDPRTNEIFVGSALIDFPRREYLVLETLMRRPNRIVTRPSLVEAVYALEDEIGSNALDAHISRIRKKLLLAEATIEIRAVRNIGYLIRAKA
ncbi:response regulator transcription factor [Rhizobium sp. CNPSo 4062]|uniref:response regulator transcription factor n=1 Tax=Rhizobium sp. CNPSo 4062 TaxID=3021410 RepID=UPI00254E4854|nr:response regulator transcription factor [Rhizobium sp. CNPSo 4062]MDK4703320.1 response regulator transcription factor [Rhizobium sp. CNPSo 4062]